VPEFKWSSCEQWGLRQIPCNAEFEGTVTTWVPGMRHDTADTYVTKWDPWILRRYHSQGGDPKRLVVHFMSFDAGVIDPLWGNFKRRDARMQELKLTRLVAPDFSTWTEMPFAAQLYNLYKSNCVTHDLVKAGYRVIAQPVTASPYLREISISSWPRDFKTCLLNGQHIRKLLRDSDSLYLDIEKQGLRMLYDHNPDATWYVYARNVDVVALYRSINPKSRWVATQVYAIDRLRAKQQKIGRLHQSLLVESEGE
jgi:hypothetical protein